MQKYNVYLSNKCIGTTLFEYADVSMGIVHGKIHFIDIQEPYKFFKDYCLHNNITLTLDDKADRAISTQVLEALKITTIGDKNVPHSGSWIEGMDSDTYSITTVCIDAEKFEQEFPHHVEEYEKQL